MKQIRKRLTYANVMSSIAVFLVLGGGAAFAAKQMLPKNSVGAKQLKKNAVNGSKVKNGSLTGEDIKLSSLGTVPSATNADIAKSADSATHAKSADSASNAAAVTPGAVTPAGLSQIPAARVYNSASQPLPNSTDTTLNFDTESFDTDNLHSATNPSRLTAPISGIYRISASVGFSASTGEIRVDLVKNGTVVVFDTQNPTTSDTTFPNPTDLVALEAGEFVEVKALQTSGGTSSAFSCSPAGACPSFSMEWVAPF